MSPRKKKLLVFVLATVGIGLWLFLVARHHPSGLEAWGEPGPVSRGHHFASCRPCHTEAGRPFRKAFHKGNAADLSFERGCGRCHGGSALSGFETPDPEALLGLVGKPRRVRPHNRRQVAADVPLCIRCHGEHEGERMTLRVGDSECIACHKELRTQDGEPRRHRQVTHFGPGGHLEFGRGPDPEQIHFAHDAHLRLQPQDAVELAPAIRQLQQRQCFFCHQPDRDGMLMEPVSFSKHCATCHGHDLRVTLAVRPVDARAEEAIRAFQQTPALAL